MPGPCPFEFSMLSFYKLLIARVGVGFPGTPEYATASECTHNLEIWSRADNGMQPGGRGAATGGVWGGIYPPQYFWVSR